MAHLSQLRSINAKGGWLTVIQDEIPFPIERVFYIHNAGNTRRGGHRHKTTIQAAVCVIGACVIETNDGVEEKSWRLDSPSQMLFLDPQDWHVMHSFTSDCVLMVLASTRFDPDDYIYENYPGSSINE